ncbi:MAG: hypothetical protein C4617_05360 [Candidatus Liberibacter europaeus]|uniref:Lipoprotein n=1 Tax=Candidatus Liberibacter europaeus TaxID=744859 RepID=A0A2T4VWF2_9HYPH|nr:hypothetical protein [Candidatus Liberibacter europaeus]PTL86112.1 MAG: hypothetical protein C4617_05360 [Candidatus Liberibacter europaeus]
MKILKYQKYLLVVLISGTLFACDLGDDGNTNTISGGGVVLSLASLTTRVAIESAKATVHTWCKISKKSKLCKKGVSIVNTAIDFFHFNNPNEPLIEKITVNS